jgi:hypothetical protein
MQKLIFLLIILFFSSVLQAQTLTQGEESQNNKFEFLFSYGLAYNAFNKNSADDNGNVISLKTPALGAYMEINLDYKLPKDRFIGLGYANQSHSDNVDNFDLSRSFGLVLDNYVSKYTKHFYDIHFRKEFDNNLHLTLGLFYNIYQFNTLDSVETGSGYFPVLSSDKMKGDEFGISLAVDYFFPIREYFEVGFRGKMYYSLVEIESLSLSPVLKFSF